MAWGSDNELKPPQQIDLSPDEHSPANRSLSDENEPSTPFRESRSFGQFESYLNPQDGSNQKKTFSGARDALERARTSKMNRDTDAISVPLSQLTLSDSDSEVRPQSSASRLMAKYGQGTPHARQLRFTTYDPSANFDSPELRRPVSAPARTNMLLRSPIQPHGELAVDLDMDDWDSLDQLVRAFDREELKTFNSVTYDQVLHELQLAPKQEWKTVLLHLGVQNEELWVDRLHNFQDDYAMRAEKRYTKHQMALKTAEMLICKRRVWFDRWMQAALLRATLLRFNSAMIAANFCSWRQLAAHLHAASAEIQNITANQTKGKALKHWRAETQQLALLAKKASEYNDSRTAALAIHKLKHRLHRFRVAELDFKLKTQQSTFAHWRRRSKEEVATAKFALDSKRIHLNSWSTKVNAFREQWDKAISVNKRNTLPNLVANWRYRLSNIESANLQASKLYAYNTKLDVLLKWKHAADRQILAKQISQQVTLRVQSEVFRKWHYSTCTALEAQRFNKFFALQRAITNWQLQTRCHTLRSEFDSRVAKHTFKQLQSRHRQEVFQQQKNRKTAVGWFGLWREKAERERRREHALELRARLQGQKFQLAAFCRHARKCIERRKQLEYVAQQVWHTSLARRTLRLLDMETKSRQRILAEATLRSRINTLRKVMAKWTLSFRQVREEQFQEVEDYAVAWHDVSVQRKTIVIWRAHTAKHRAATDTAHIMDLQRVFRHWMGRYVGIEEQRAHAGALFIANSRTKVLRQWQKRLAYARQAGMELELFESGRAMERISTLLEKWRATAALARDKQSLLESRMTWHLQRQRRHKFRKWRQRAEKTAQGPQTPLRSEKVFQRSTVKRWLSQRSEKPPVFAIPLHRVDSGGSPILRPGADTLI